jgi:hypothetical protein
MINPEHLKYVEFHTYENEQCRIRIESPQLKESVSEQTAKSLTDVLTFLRVKTESTPIKNLNSLNSINIEAFNLSCSIEPKSQFTTDRFFSHTTKFIPMKTQSSSLMKEHTLK